MQQGQVQEVKARASDLPHGAKPSFVDFLRASPLVGVDLDLERDTSPMRDVEL